MTAAIEVAIWIILGGVAAFIYMVNARLAGLTDWTETVASAVQSIDKKLDIRKVEEIGFDIEAGEELDEDWESEEIEHWEDPVEFKEE